MTTETDVLEFIRAYKEQNHGRTPSHREIMDGLGMTSHDTLNNRLGLLREWGLIDWEPGQARSIVVLS